MELEWVFLSMWLPAAEPLWDSLGEEGSEQSVISSMSECDEADLGDFFLLKACLKELRSWGQRGGRRGEPRSHRAGGGERERTGVKGRQEAVKEWRSVGGSAREEEGGRRKWGSSGGLGGGSRHKRL